MLHQNLQANVKAVQLLPIKISFGNLLEFQKTGLIVPQTFQYTAAIYKFFG
jgi:hypothetical protein